MACCGNCENGTGPCADAWHQALQESPRPLGGIARKIGVGQFTVGGMAVAPPVGGVAGAAGAWWLAGMIFGRRNTLAKAASAAVGAYAGWQAGQASGL
jgi:hypothetical protein